MKWKKGGSTFLEKKSKFPTIRHVLDSLSVLPSVVSKQVVVTSPPGESRGPPSWKPHWPDEVKPTIPHGQLPTAMTAPRCNAGCEEMPPKYPSQPNRTPPWATGYVNKEQNKLALIGGAKIFELDCVVFCFFSLVKGEHVLLCGTFPMDHSCACWSIKTTRNTSVMSDFHTTANCSACTMPFFHVAKNGTRGSSNATCSRHKRKHREKVFPFFLSLWH